MFSQSLKNTASLFMVEGKVIFGVDTDVVHINFQPLFSYHVGEDMVHKGVKCRWHIAKPKEHHHWFKKSLGGDEGSFPLVFFTNADVIIAPSDVKLHEEGGILHVVDEFRDKWQGIRIPDGVGIKISLVLART